MGILRRFILGKYALIRGKNAIDNPRQPPLSPMSMTGKDKIKVIFCIRIDPFRTMCQ